MGPDSLILPSSATVFELAKCEKQPDPIAHSIQSVGVLLAVRADDLTILQASDSLLQWLGIYPEAVLDQSLAALTGETFSQTVTLQVAKYKSDNTSLDTKIPPLLVTLNHAKTGLPVSFDVLITRSQSNLLIMELEPKQGESEIAEDQLPFVLKSLIEQVCDCQSVADLLTLTSSAVRQVTGFDRVMVYRFHKDWHGEVMAEAKDERLEPSYYGLNFPASYIPQPARDLYLKTPLRLIGCVSADASRLIPELNPDTGQSLDLSLATLRSVSLTHTDYLQSMGVAASMALSIFQRHQLWGLVVCHHQTPYWIAHQTRSLCELLMQVISLQLMNLTESNSLTRRLMQKEQLATLLLQLTHDELELGTVLREGQPSLAQLFDLQGVVICQKPPSDYSFPGGEIPAITCMTTWGTVPTPALGLIQDWLARTRCSAEVVLTDRFGEEYRKTLPSHTGNTLPELPDELVEVGGLVYLPLSSSGDEYILGFRQELAKTITWYCNISHEALPLEAVSFGPSPSSKRLQQSIRGQSLPFTEIHHELATHLRLSVLERINRQARRHHEHQLESLNTVLAKELHERKLIESQLVHSQKMESLGQLAAGVAHELNNPIGFVKSNLSTLTHYMQSYQRVLDASSELVKTLKTNPDAATLEAHRAALEALFAKEEIAYIAEDVTDLLNESREGTDRVCEIVQHLRSFVRLDEQGWKHAEINDGIESTLKIIWNEVKYKCTLHKDYGQLPSLYCNMGQLNQVFMNLMVNAVQAIDGKGDLTITTRATETAITVAFSDTGSGIAPDMIKDIFNPFFTTKPVGKGTGLGLSISYNIIEKHKGRIEVDSVLGQGTTFTVHLPYPSCDTVHLTELETA